MFSIRHSLFISLLALSCGCATGGSPVAETTTIDPTPDPPSESIIYTIDVSDADTGSIEIAVTIDAGDSGSTVFSIDESWGLLNGIPSLISEVSATNATGLELAVSNPADNRWEVAHKPGERIQFRYRLSGEMPGGQTTPTSLMFTPHIQPEQIFILGPVALVAPENLVDQNEEVTVELRWEGVPSQWETISSLAVERQTSVEGTLADLRRIVLYAGSDLRVHRREVRGNPVYLAISGTWNFSDQELADITADIIDAEREFFDDDSQKHFVVAALPVLLDGTPFEGASMKSGTGLYQSFAMFLSPDTALASKEDFRLKHLLVHELFHTWNRERFLRMPSTNEAEVYWFTEGFTGHFTREILRETELITPDQYVQDLNEQLQAYQANPLRKASNTELAKKFWESRDARELAYQRGALLALGIDHEIRMRSQGEKSLADLMRHLHATEQPADIPANDHIFGVIAEFTDAEFADGAREHVLKGRPITPDPDALGPCYQLRETTKERPIFGFALERTLSSQVVHGVQSGSNAAEAGLEDGQKVLGFEKKNAENVELHLTVETAEGPVTAIVSPDFESFEVIGYRRVEGKTCGADGVPTR